MIESIKTKIELIRLFLKYPIFSIPIVSSKKKIIGFISKQEIIASSGIKADISIPIDEVIKHHTNPVTSSDISSLNLLLKNFDKVKKIPVMDNMGNIVDRWQKFQLIRAFEGEEEEISFYPKIFDHFPSGVVITSASNKIIYLNQAASLLSNIKGRKIGRNFFDVFSFKIEPPALRKEEKGIICDAGYIKEDENITGIIYILTPSKITER